MQAYNLTALVQLAAENDIQIVYVPNKCESSKSRAGMHLLNPESWELERAIEIATRDGFTVIYIHREF